MSIQKLKKSTEASQAIIRKMQKETEALHTELKQNDETPYAGD